MSDFGEWLRSERREQGLTVADVARAAKCSANTVRLIEKGEWMPQEKTKERIRDAMVSLRLNPKDIPDPSKNWRLTCGEEPRYAVIALTAAREWRIMGFYLRYRDACVAASYLLPIRGGGCIDAFVFKEADF